ncbi:MAG TPA: signal peptidase I [Candidatus Limnocylindrales bacterium]|nr:signal peptidase I [Candidatus Limnocylindrales bacterium]
MTAADNSSPESNEPAEQELSAAPQARANSWRKYLPTIAFIMAAPLLAVLLTAFVFQSYEVQGRSMVATLNDQDRLIIWKLPQTVSKITRHAYIPHRGDIIVFNVSGLYENGTATEKQLIKRVIGLPGDRVVLRDGHYVIYNAEHPEGYDPDINQEFSANIAHPTLGSVDLTVPQDEVFVSGDNRTNSRDSRSFGPVDSRAIIGKLALRIIPVSKAKSFN